MGIDVRERFAQKFFAACLFAASDGHVYDYGHRGVACGLEVGAHGVVMRFVSRRDDTDIVWVFLRSSFLGRQSCAFMWLFRCVVVSSSLVKNVPAGVRRCLRLSATNDDEFDTCDIAFYDTWTNNIVAGGIDMKVLVLIEAQKDIFIQSARPYYQHLDRWIHHSFVPPIRI